MRFIALSAAALLLVLAQPSASVTDSQRVFACNYTVSMTFDGQTFVVTQQSRVRDGSYIPIDTSDVRLRMHFSSKEADQVLIGLTLLEPFGTGWKDIYPEPLSFETSFGEPTEFAYEDDIVAIEIALIVSEAAR